VSCWAIVAINSHLRRKRRLQAVLDAAGRDRLAQHMLGRVLAAAAGARSVSRVLIVSPDDQGLPAGYEVVHDSGAGLNAAFGQARARVRGAQVAGVVLLPADLPELAAADVDALVGAGRQTRIAIAPDRRGLGTNGLYLVADLDFCCRFGVDSRARHEAEARRLGIEPGIVMRAGLAEDLDTPADLQSFIGRGRVASAAAGWLERRA
jgi:2-phospho-L-lactate guanylyltransferase